MDKGLNIGGLIYHNWGLLRKWWWRFYTKEEALWRRVILSVYREDGGLSGEDSIRNRGSIWGNIAKIGRDLGNIGVNFSDSFGNKVWNGMETKFWEDG